MNAWAQMTTFIFPKLLAQTYLYCLVKGSHPGPLIKKAHNSHVYRKPLEEPRCCHSINFLRAQIINFCCGRSRDIPSLRISLKA